jgi:hypothetical protein
VPSSTMIVSTKAALLLLIVAFCTGLPGCFIQAPFAQAHREHQKLSLTCTRLRCNCATNSVRARRKENPCTSHAGECPHIP